jgi:hypothetical protein
MTTSYTGFCKEGSKANGNASVTHIRCESTAGRQPIPLKDYKDRGIEPKDWESLPWCEDVGAPVGQPLIRKGDVGQKPDRTKKP